MNFALETITTSPIQVLPSNQTNLYRILSIKTSIHWIDWYW